MSVLFSACVAALPLGPDPGEERGDGNLPLRSQAEGQGVARREDAEAGHVGAEVDEEA